MDEVSLFHLQRRVLSGRPRPAARTGPRSRLSRGLWRSCIRKREARLPPRPPGVLLCHNRWEACRPQVSCWATTSARSAGRHRLPQNGRGYSELRWKHLLLIYATCSGSVSPLFTTWFHTRNVFSHSLRYLIFNCGERWLTSR